MRMFELLVGLGLPSACVAMVIIAWLFKTEHARISAAAAWVAVGLVAVFGVIQLVDVTRGKVSIDIHPKDAMAFTPAGHPVELEISVSRGSQILEKGRVEALPESRLRARPLALDRADDGLAVTHDGYRIGLLQNQRLRDIGWLPAEDCTGPESAEPRFWHTRRVHAGQTHRLGETRFGILTITAAQFTADGRAVVTLKLAGRNEPIPREVLVENKGLDIQSFAEVPEFYIAVREADFTGDAPWAAFSVFSMQ